MFIVDESTKCFLEIPQDHPFPIQNLPWGVFRTRQDRQPRVGVAIGDWVLDLKVMASHGWTPVPGQGSVFDQSSLNPLMALGRSAWTDLRRELVVLLSSPDSPLCTDQQLRRSALIARDQVQMLMPVEIGDYTDFYSSRHHAVNVGTMIRGAENALQENWSHLPVAYHGRASSVVVSGTDIVRPHGQTGAGQFGPTRALDIELEVGFFVGVPNPLGQPVRISSAADHIFGLVLVNDWSARDIQKWEYVPLGPFLSKSFATSISPWVVPLDALMPFRTEPTSQDPQPLPYLRWSDDFLLDLQLEVALRPAGSVHSQTIIQSNFRHMYWSMAQQLAHHTVGGCNLRSGDLLASGTVSGPEKRSRGCLLELTWRGEEPLALRDGVQRVFLENGDEVTMTGWCQGNGFRIGMGDVSGRIVAEHEQDNHQRS